MDIFTKEKRSDVMSKIKSKRNASTELKLISLFKEHKITGWRRNIKIFGHPDIAFPKMKIAVFIDGCFWHNCPFCGTLPKTNKKYWIPKLGKNKKRDLLVSRTLRKKGWHVIRIKECQLKKYPYMQVQRIKKKIDILKNLFV